MAQRELYKSVAASGEVYFPLHLILTLCSHIFPTRLFKTANDFYNFTKGWWICLQLRRSALRKLGIVTKLEEPNPVGQTEMGETWNWVCSNIFSFIPAWVPGIVTSLYEIQRDAEGKYISVSGLTGDKSWYHSKCTNRSNITYLIATLCYGFVSVFLPIPTCALKSNCIINFFLNYCLLKLLQTFLFHIPNIISTWKIGFKFCPLFTHNQYWSRQQFLVSSDSLMSCI